MMAGVVILLMVFSAHGYDDPVRPHDVLRFYNLQDCINARQAYLEHSDHKHAYECLTGVVVERK